MNTTDTSLLGDLLDNAAKRRRFHMLPMYSRITVIAGSILGGICCLFFVIFLFSSVLSGAIIDVGTVILFMIVILFSVTFCLGNALIWAERKEAIIVGYAGSICGMMFSLLFVMNFMEGATFILFLISTPFIVLYILQLVALIKIRHAWKNEGLPL